MTFSGRDYHAAFEEIATAHATEPGSEELRGDLVRLEWILWEAVRDGVAKGSMVLAALLVLPLGYAFRANEAGWLIALALALAWLGVTVAIYWLFRLALWETLTSGIRGRKFGDGGITLPA